MSTETNLSKLLESVCAEMERLEYARHSIKEFLGYCRRYGRFVESIGKPDVFSEDLAARFLKERYDYPSNETDKISRLSSTIYSAAYSMRRLGSFHLYGSFSGRWKKTQSDYDWANKDSDWVKLYLASVENIDDSQSTKTGRIYAIKDYYKFLDAKGLSTVSGINANIITSYILSMQGRAQSTVQRIIGKLRPYFQFLHANGVIPTDLSTALPRVKLWNRGKLPILWNKDDTEKMLNSVDRAGNVGKRDYALLLLIAQLGIRASDVAGMRFEHLKWESKQLCFTQQKTKEPVCLPLLDDVGWAIIDYIKYARPKSHSPFLFLTCNAPFRMLTPGAVTSIVYRHMDLCGIERNKEFHCGAHALRHAMARRLTEQGTPLSTISNIMGHTNYRSASPYLRVDIEGMRECALSLKGVGSYVE